MVREVIVLNVGVGGIQLSYPIWKQFNAEHKIDIEGKLVDKVDQDNNFRILYHETKTGKFIPRNISFVFLTKFLNFLQISLSLLNRLIQVLK